jgi:hypothetical protein
LRPITPPFLLMSEMVMSAVSFSDVSEIAIVPDSECRTPTLIGPVSAACAFDIGNWPARASAPDIEPNFRRLRRFMCFPLPICCGEPYMRGVLGGLYCL